MIGLSVRHQEDSLADLLQAAHGGSLEALGQLLEACRLYLLAVARQELCASLQAKVDAADLVQETFAEATRDFAHFRGVTEAQLLGWLRGILLHNLTDFTRSFSMGCRCIAQEVRLREHIVDLVPTRATERTICEQLIAQEQYRALNAALQRLPSSYRQILYLRYDERWSFAEIGNCLQRSPEAARKLWRRALTRLRQDMRIHADI